MIKQFKHICKTPQYFCRIVVWDSWLLPLKGDCRNVTWMLRFSHTQAGFIVPTGISFHGCSPNFLIVIQPRIRWIEPEPCRSSFCRVFNNYCLNTLKVFSTLLKRSLKSGQKMDDNDNSCLICQFFEMDEKDVISFSTVSLKRMHRLLVDLLSR